MVGRIMSLSLKSSHKNKCEYLHLRQSLSDIVSFFDGATRYKKHAVFYSG